MLAGDLSRRGEQGQCLSVARIALQHGAQVPDRLVALARA
jgi:hypothetical protein